MSNDLLIKRKKQFLAWKALLSQRQGRTPNPLHEPGDYRKSKHADDLGKHVSLPELSDEFAAWEAASDEDFEAFESSLG